MCFYLSFSAYATFVAGLSFGLHIFMFRMLSTQIIYCVYFDAVPNYDRSSTRAFNWYSFKKRKIRNIVYFFLFYAESVEARNQYLIFWDFILLFVEFVM